MVNQFQEFGGNQTIDDTLDEFGGTTNDANNPFYEFGGKPLPTDTKIPAKDFYANYMASPIYKKRLEAGGNTFDENGVKDLANTHIINQPGYGSNQYDKNTSYLINSDADFRNKMKANGLKIDPNNANINIDSNDIPLAKKVYGANVTREQILAHELGHQVRPLGAGDIFIINSLKNKNTNNLNNKFGDTSEHDDNPEENYADLNALRYLMQKKGVYDTSKRDMTMDDFKKASNDAEIKNSVIFKRITQRFKPENLILLNNTIAYNNQQKSNTLTA